MHRIPVDSTTLRSVGYDAGSQTLELEFQSGSIYQYYEVPPLIYEELVAADSHGRFFNSCIRGGYRYDKL